MGSSGINASTFFFFFFFLFSTASPHSRHTSCCSTCPPPSTVVEQGLTSCLAMRACGDPKITGPILSHEISKAVSVRAKDKYCRASSCGRQSHGLCQREGEGPRGGQGTSAAIVERQRRGGHHEWGGG